MNNKYLFLIIIICLNILIYTNAALARQKFTTYKNPQYGFSFKYPGTWRTETPMSNKGLIKIVSHDGYGTESCNVNINTVPSLKNTSTSKIIKSMNSKYFIDTMRAAGVTDVRVINSGPTNLFNREAYYAIIDYTVRTMGVEIPSRVIQVITTKEDIVYAITCGTVEPENFSKVLPTFQFIMGSFFIEP